MLFAGDHLATNPSPHSGLGAGVGVCTAKSWSLDAGVGSYVGVGEGICGVGVEKGVAYEFGIGVE